MSLMKKEPPRVRGIPLVGNVLDMARDPAAFFVACYQMHGPIFRIRLLGAEYTVLAGPEANIFMARQGAQVLRSREFWQGLVEEFGAKKALVSTDGEVHARLRGVMRSGYARSTLRGRYQEVVEITDDILAQQWPSGRTVPVVDAMQRLAAEQLGRLLVGESPAAYFEELRTFIRLVLNVRVTHQRPRVLLYSPVYRRAKARVRELGERIVARYDHTEPGVDPPTLIHDILQAARQDPSLFPGTEVQVAVTGPYFAGLDTVANTTAAMLYAVLKHAWLREQIESEVDALFSAGVPTPAGLRRMPVLHGALMETLRMYPIAVAAMRNASQDFEFEGYAIAAGQPLFMATTVSHFLPRFYPEPFRFDIERFQKPREEHRQPGAFAPFGLGPHTCLGAGLAEDLIMLSMARLFHQLHMALSPPDYNLRMKVAPTPGPEPGFRVQVRGRRTAEV